MNTYGYVRGNPINSVDRYGLLDDLFPDDGENPFGDDEIDLPTIGAFTDDFYNYSAGLGDALLLGFGDEIRGYFDIGSINKCSKAYKYGGWTSFGAGGARLVYAGAAKGYSIIAPSGQAASIFRTKLKNIFRLNAAKNWRPPNLKKYKTDEALRAAAGRTNKPINAYGAGVAAAGAMGGSGCGCE